MLSALSIIKISEIVMGKQVTTVSAASCSLAMSRKNQTALPLSPTSCFKSNSSKIRLSSRQGSAKTSYRESRAHERCQQTQTSSNRKRKYQGLAAKLLANLMIRNFSYVAYILSEEMPYISSPTSIIILGLTKSQNCYNCKKRRWGTTWNLGGKQLVIAPPNKGRTKQSSPDISLPIFLWTPFFGCLQIQITRIFNKKSWSGCLIMILEIWRQLKPISVKIISFKMRKLL